MPFQRTHLATLSDKVKHRKRSYLVKQVINGIIKSQLDKENECSLWYNVFANLHISGEVDYLWLGKFIRSWGILLFDSLWLNVTKYACKTSGCQVSSWTANSGKHCFYPNVGVLRLNNCVWLQIPLGHRVGNLNRFVQKYINRSRYFSRIDNNGCHLSTHDTTDTSLRTKLTRENALRSFLSVRILSIV